MTKALWIIFVSIPLVFSTVGLFTFVMLGVADKEPVAILGVLLFGSISGYLFRVLVHAYRGDGVMLEPSETGTDTFPLGYAGKEPGFFSYLTYVLLGPMAFLIFNKGQLPKFSGPQLDEPKKRAMTWIFLLCAYGVIGMGAIAIMGSFDLAVSIILGMVLIVLAVGWIINFFILSFLTHNRKSFFPSRKPVERKLQE